MVELDFPDLNEKQVEKLSDIASDLALIAVASVVIPAAFDKFDPIMVVSGLIAAIIFWLISLWLRK